MTATPSAPFSPRKQGAAPDAAARDRRDDYRYATQSSLEPPAAPRPATDAARKPPRSGPDGGHGRAAEPSMEELLASIRRIIAEEDLSSPPARRPPERPERNAAEADFSTPNRSRFTPPRPDPADLDPPDFDPPEDEVSEGDRVDDFAYGLPAHSARPARVEPAPSGKIGRGPAPVNGLRAPPPGPRPVDGVERAPQALRPASPPVGAEAQAPGLRRPAPADPRPAPAAAAPRPVSVSEMLENMARSAFDSRSDAAEPAAGTFVPRPEARAPRKDLLSPRADAAVSAAFESLGDLKLPQRERTVEDLVKEILRPMLKDWLDANLPDIVERLVRAEIERVARTHRG